MKTILTGLLMVFAISTFAQKEYKYTVKGNASDTWVTIELLGADIVVEGAIGSDIRVTSSDYRGLPEKAKGLKPLSAAGVDNTGLGLAVTQEGNKIRIVGTDRSSDDSEYKIYLPKALNLKVEYNNWQAGDVVIRGMAGEVEARVQNSDLELYDLTGPLVAHTLSSDLKISFSSLSQTSPSSLTSTSGDIEMTVPASAKGTFKMGTISGGVYTDMDFDLGEESQTRRIGGMSSTGKLNGGGVEVAVKTISGDIYIRKGK